MMKKRFTLLCGVAAASVLAACGGGGGDDGTSGGPQAFNQVPASASASVEAYTRYAGSLANTETGLPLGVAEVKPPTSETAAAATF